MQVVRPETLSCGNCVLYRFDYCQSVNKTTQLFTNMKGTCGYSEELNPVAPAAPLYRCSDLYFKTDKDEWLTFLPCPFLTTKCGTKNQSINVTNTV